MKKELNDFCDGCCYRKDCENEIEKCCFYIKNKCIIQEIKRKGD